MQEKAAYFFCVSDRALLCRDCDVSVHGKTELAKKHQRLFVTGAKAGLEALPHNSNGEATSSAMSSTSSEVASGVELGGGRHAPSSSLYGSTAQRDTLVRPSIASAQVLTSPSPSSNWTAVPKQVPTPPSLNSSVQSGPIVASYAPRSMAMANNLPVSLANRGGDGYSVGAQVSNVNGAGQTAQEFDYSIGVEEFLGIPNISGYSFGDVASSKVCGFGAQCLTLKLVVM